MLYIAHLLRPATILMIYLDTATETHSQIESTAPMDYQAGSFVLERKTELGSLDVTKRMDLQVMWVDGPSRDLARVSSPSTISVLAFSSQ